MAERRGDRARFVGSGVGTRRRAFFNARVALLPQIDGIVGLVCIRAGAIIHGACIPMTGFARALRRRRREDHRSGRVAAGFPAHELFAMLISSKDRDSDRCHFSLQPNMFVKQNHGLSRINSLLIFFSSQALAAPVLPYALQAALGKKISTTGGSADWRPQAPRCSATG